MKRSCIRHDFLRIHLKDGLGYLVEFLPFLLLLNLIGAFTHLQFPSLAVAWSPIVFSTIGKGYHSGIREPLKIVIETHDQWTALWTRHMSIRTNLPPPPEIDFSAEMVVGIFLGEQRTGGYGIEITGIKEDMGQHRLNVYFVETRPPRNAMVIQALTQPYHIVKTKKVDLPVVFRPTPASSHPF